MQVPPSLPSMKIRKAQEAQWEKSFAELRAFQEQHGHFRVPSTSPLGKWAIKQRIQYRKSGTLPGRRARRLAAAGFPLDLKDVTWKDAFRALCAFQELEGHCRVPRSYVVEGHSRVPGRPPLTLGRWVEKQRQYHRNNKLSEERCRLLEDVGLAWTDTHGAGWEKKFRELVRYKEREGDCNVPVRYSANPPLGNWVTSQRQKYKKGKLSQERLEKLKEIDFSWKIGSKGKTSNPGEERGTNGAKPKTPPCAREARARKPQLTRDDGAAAVPDHQPVACGRDGASREASKSKTCSAHKEGPAIAEKEECNAGVRHYRSLLVASDNNACTTIAASPRRVGILTADNTVWEASAPNKSVVASVIADANKSCHANDSDHVDAVGLRPAPIATARILRENYQTSRQTMTMRHSDLFLSILFSTAVDTLAAEDANDRDDILGAWIWRSLRSAASLMTAAAVPSAVPPPIEDLGVLAATGLGRRGPPK